MFTSQHAVFKFAYAGDEIDDWLNQAAWLIERWSNQTKDEVEFQDTFEVILAALLCHDDLLPKSAKQALSHLVLKIVSEATERKHVLECLHIYPPKPGRKHDRRKIHLRNRMVINLIQSGMSATAAYKVVAKKESKSLDTIRRDYERYVGNGRKR